MLLRYKKNWIVNCTILGAVSGGTRFQSVNTHAGIQQSRNPPATQAMVQLMFISCTEILTLAWSLEFCKDGATLT